MEGMDDSVKQVHPSEEAGVVGLAEGGGGVGGRACAGKTREAAPVPVLLMRGGAGFTPDDTGTGAVVGPAAAVFRYKCLWH